VGIVVYVKYGGWVVKRVREGEVLTRIPDGVLTDGAIATYGCSWVDGGLGDVSMWGWVGCDDNLL